MFLSTASFYYARKRNWTTSGVFAGLAFLDRFSGIALIPALALEWYLQNKQTLHSFKLAVKRFLRTGFVAIFLCALGFMTYLVYLQIYYGDFLLFQKARTSWDPDKIVFPLQVVWRYLKIFWFLDKSLVEYWVAVLEFISLFAYLGLSWWVAKKVRLSYGVFMAVLLLIVPFTGTFAGNPRYILHVFPAYIFLALLFPEEKTKSRVLLFFILLAFFLNGLFTRGYFIS